MPDTHETAATRPSGLQGSGRGRFADPAFRWLLVGAGGSVLVILALMIASTTLDAWPVFAKEGVDFFVGREWRPGGSRGEITGAYGALPFIYGTLVTSFIAIVLALPLSLGVALAVTEILPTPLRRPLTYAVELLAAVPSVVYGLWGLLFFVPVILRPVMRFLAASLGRVVPIFSGPVLALNYFSAGVVLAIMILPIITAIIREVFVTVPEGDRHAAYGLGATRWEVMRHVVLVRSTPGIIGATMLGLGRALGETIAVALLVGSSIDIKGSVFQPGYSIAAVIANTFQESSPEGVRALIALGVTLFVITIIVNVAARLIVWRMQPAGTGGGA